MNPDNQNPFETKMAGMLSGMDKPLHLLANPSRTQALFRVSPKGLPAKKLFWSTLFADVRQRFPLLLGLFLCCVASYFLASRYMVCTVVIRGRSMTPTLRDGDQFLLNRIAYLFREPRRADLVVIHDPGHSDLAIKRIVGLPGDYIEIKNGAVYVNEKRITEPYLAPNTLTLPGEPTRQAVRLGENRYFVMGDNRSESEDSRFYGPIHRNQVVGVVSL